MNNSRISSIVLWSVISAAFVGPGTVTTAVKAGSIYQLDLLWAVAFATMACIVLQEAAARLTITSGHSLGQLIAVKFGSKGRIFQHFVGWSVILGCAAFEAGNLAGAVSGLSILLPVEPWHMVVGIGVIAGFVLWLEEPYWLSGLMFFLVALMGMAFLVLASNSRYSINDIALSLKEWNVPSGSYLLVLGLLGTTIVPYNLFVGAGIGKTQSLSLMRTGLIISVLLGGLITATILLGGTLVPGFNEFQDLQQSLRNETGGFGVIALSAGLFAAGFSSAVTAPFAATVIGSTVLEWQPSSLKWLWIGVLLTGVVVSMSGFRPVQLIIFVQALNALNLPLLVAILILMVNDKKIVPSPNRPGIVYNILLVTIFIVVTIISAMHFFA